MILTKANPFIQSPVAPRCSIYVTYHSTSTRSPTWKSSNSGIASPPSTTIMYSARLGEDRTYESCRGGREPQTMIGPPLRTRSSESNNVEHIVTIREFLMNNQLARSFEFLVSKQLLAIVFYIFRPYSTTGTDSLNQPAPLNLHKIQQCTSLFLINVEFLDPLDECGDFF